MEEKPKRHVRRRALLHAVVSGVVATLLCVALLKWSEAGGKAGRGLLLATAVPAAWFLIQLAVLATGIPFATMAKSWDSLSGGQRFVLSMAILAIAAVVFGGIGVAATMSFGGHN
jgi:hypothetical protein